MFTFCSVKFHICVKESKQECQIYHYFFQHAIMPWWQPWLTASMELIIRSSLLSVVCSLLAGLFFFLSFCFLALMLSSSVFIVPLPQKRCLSLIGQCYSQIVWSDEHADESQEAKSIVVCLTFVTRCPIESVIVSCLSVIGTNASLGKTTLSIIDLLWHSFKSLGSQPGNWKIELSYALCSLGFTSNKHWKFLVNERGYSSLLKWAISQ